MADTVTMSASHYERLTHKAGEHKASGMYGEYGLTIAKRNKQAFITIAGAGLGWWLLSNKTWSDKISLFKEHWWLKSLLVLAIGWWLWRKQNQYALIVLAVGATLFAQAWRVEQNKGKKPGDQTETGDYAWDAGAGQWVKTSPGGEVLMPGGGNDQSEQFAKRVFENARAA